MKTIVLYKKAIPITAVTICIILASSLLYSNKKLSNKLSDERLKSEILLSEKLSLDKLVAKNIADMESIKNKNLMLNKKIVESNLEIQQKQAKIERLIAENVSVKEIKKQNTDLEAMLSQLNQQVDELKKMEELAKNENKKSNDQVAYLSTLNSELSADNSILKAMISDNYRTEALRGKNEKLTVKATKTNKLVVSFDVRSSQGNNVYFKIVTPDGNEYSSMNDDASAEIIIIEENPQLVASSDNSVMTDGGNKRVEMYYKPNQKLSKGIYQFSIYNGERHLGSTQLRLK